MDIVGIVGWMDCWMDHRMNVDKSLDGLLD